jgi:hypothetical protein
MKVGAGWTVALCGAALLLPHLAAADPIAGLGDPGRRLARRA